MMAKTLSDVLGNAIDTSFIQPIKSMLTPIEDLPREELEKRYKAIRNNLSDLNIENEKLQEENETLQEKLNWQPLLVTKTAYDKLDQEHKDLRVKYEAKLQELDQKYAECKEYAEKYANEAHRANKQADELFGVTEELKYTKALLKIYL